LRVAKRTGRRSGEVTSRPPSNRIVQIKGIGPHLVDSQGSAWTASYVQEGGNVVRDLRADISAEAGARQTYEALIKETHLLRQSALSTTSRMRESNTEHKAIVAAMLAGDRDRARLLAEHHAHGGKRRWHDARQEIGDPASRLKLSEPATESSVPQTGLRENEKPELGKAKPRRARRP